MTCSIRSALEGLGFPSVAPGLGFFVLIDDTAQSLHVIGSVICSGATIGNLDSIKNLNRLLNPYSDVLSSRLFWIEVVLCMLLRILSNWTKKNLQSNKFSSTYLKSLHRRTSTSNRLFLKLHLKFYRKHYKTRSSYL